ncbi:MAG: PGF-pre-PGF domain-containing protein, partial [Methanomicrobiales archaeon]|nr:PGF-pre-PGF domain-containing protein [Methanomicrobiales archaeon]
TVGSIVPSTGLFTALAEGTTTVTASAGDVTGTATVIVSDEEPVEPIVVCVEVYPSPVTLDIGDTNQFSATAFDQDDNVVAGVEFEWSCSGQDIGTIDEYGLFTALAAGTAVVTATVDGISGTADLTINAGEPALARIVVIPSAATIEVGGDLEYRAVAFDRFGNLVPDADITWECCNGGIGSIDESGFFTALSSGTATITACGDGAKGSATVTVNCNAPTLDRIVVIPSAITLTEGDTAAFTATAFDQDGIEMPDVEVAWGCDNPVVGEIDESGFFTALVAGTATVTATAEGIPGAAEVTVTGEPADLTISPSDIILSTGDEWQFTLYGLQENVSSSAVSWSCDDPDVGMFRNSGLFIAQGEGSATIIAKVGETDDTVTATVTVLSILPSGPARIEVSPSDFFIPAGETILLTATVYDRHGHPMDIDVEWESCDEDVGTIDEHGLFTALNDGEVRLIASVDGVYDSACVTVEPSIPVPSCIEIDPDTATLDPGETRKFIATVFDQCDCVMDWVRVAWSCSDDHVGTIDRSGTFAALAQGSTGVTACAGGIERAASVTVIAAPTPDPTSSPQGGSWSGGADTSGPSFSAGICEGLNGGETHTFSGATTSIDSIAVTALSNIPRLLLTVKETRCPNQAQSPGDAYEYIEIETSWVTPDQIAGAVVTFTIPAEWLDEHGILPEDVRLMRYVDGGWQILTTEVIGEENGVYRFRATTPGFSTFVIAAAPESVVTPVETITAVTNVTTSATEEPTTAVTTVPVTTTPTTPLVYAPFLAPLAFLFWRRKN